MDAKSDEFATTCFTVEGKTPKANDDSATTTTATPVTINILGNDEYQNMDEWNFIMSFQDPATDSVLIDNEDGTITYTPSPTFQSGDITIPYTISDDWGSSDAIITVAVGYEFIRTAADDVITILQGQTAMIDISANDINPGARDVLNYQVYWGDMGNCLDSQTWSSTTFQFTVVAKTDVVRSCSMKYWYMDYPESVGTITVQVVAPSRRLRSRSTRASAYFGHTHAIQ